MLSEATARVYSLLTSVWPSGVQLLDADSKTTFEDALRTGQPVVRFWPVSLTRVEGGLAWCLASLDVCHGTARVAREEADRLVQAIHTTARNPNGLLAPTTAPLKEATYHRVHVRWTVLVNATQAPEEVS